MSIFCYKPITPSVHIGEHLKHCREMRGQKIETLASALKLPLEYISAIEQGNFRALPKARGFRAAYIRSYAKALSADADNCVRQFLAEGGVEDAQIKHPLQSIRHFPFASISMAARGIALATLVLLFSGYLGWQVHRILTPPKLTVFSPLEGDIARDLAILIQGETDPETKLTVNGQGLMVNERGTFESKLDGAAGLNTITIIATKKHGRTTTITRHVVVQPHAAVSMIKLPQNP